MAPSPEDDKAPDKSKSEKTNPSDNPKEKDKDEKTLSNLNDGELKALLDEAINYKNPKDREGKSKLFTDLLIQAEEVERIARAASAGGSELVRHCNSSARRSHRARDGGGTRHHRRKPTSISENVMHGGSLDNLAKEELYLESTHHHKRKSVSARQREGGSLPCDVNSSVVPARDYQFLEEARKNRAMKDKEYTSIEIDSLETERLLDHDTLGRNYEEQQEITIVPRYTSKATLQISATPVDDPIPLDLDSSVDKKPYDLESLQTKVLHSKYSVYIPTYRNTEERKVDENGNAVHQNTGTKAKKKKTQTDKNVVVLKAESVEGHRSDIINDVDKLMQYIGGDKDTITTGKTKSNLHKSKQLQKQHASEDGPRSKKQRAHSSKGKENRSELKKSNSLGEISTAKLDEFAFASSGEKNRDNKIVLRSNKGHGDKPKERRSWGNVEPPPFGISSNVSSEHLETAEHWVVTKPKKKSKKRRNSISSGRRQNSSSDTNANQNTNRGASPDLGGKSACSVPQSDKSNDSSDVDSVHSLPIDGINVPVSYADIAKNSEKLKEKKVSPEKPEKVPNKEKSTLNVETESKPPVIKQTIKKTVAEKNLVLNPVVNNIKNNPLPDVHIPKNVPAIPPDHTTKSHTATPPEVTTVKSYQTMPLEASAKSSPAIPSEENNVKSLLPKSSDLNNVNSVPSIPPDVHNMKSFPAISNNNNNNNTSKSLSVEKTNYKNTTVSNKVRNIFSASKSATKGGNNNVNVKLSVSVGAPVVQNDIQNDLSIIHLNEKESIQFNAQMLPPNIPDVQTIEKMHFMNRHLPPPHQQQQCSPVQIHAPIAQPTPVPQLSPGPPAEPAPVATPLENITNNTTINNVNCDTSERLISEDDEGPPPVIILSGLGNKEVPGLVFGFDINEQLLNDDICDNFISRYVMPEVFNHPSHNHDKIVAFIGSAWEAMVSQSNGKVQYYKEES